jgi:hypothetical protein
MELYHRKEDAEDIELFDTKTGIKIGVVKRLYDQEYDYMAIPIGNNRPQKMFMIKHCAIGYIGACTYKRSKSINKDKQLKIYSL